MVSTRDRVLNLVDYIESVGVTVNIGKTKARGNKGFFKVTGESYRIDISSKIDSEAVLGVLVHEFAHYIHYSYDKTLKTLDFLFDDFSDILLEEMLNLTVDLIPKNSVAPLFNEKNSLKINVKNSSSIIRKRYPDFKISKPYEILEKKVKKTQYKYLLKHDVVKLINLFSVKTLDIKSLNTQNNGLELEAIEYLRLKSYQRKLNKINSRISKLNRYYNSPTELFARSIEYYLLNPNLMKEKAPLLKAKLDEIISSNKISYLTNMVNICNISI